MGRVSESSGGGAPGLYVIWFSSVFRIFRVNFLVRRRKGVGTGADG